jgi:hypothetical protein
MCVNSKLENSKPPSLNLYKPHKNPSKPFKNKEKLAIPKKMCVITKPYQNTNLPNPPSLTCVEA